VPHPSEHSPASRPLGADEAATLAESMVVFGAASRLRILYALLDGERHVDDLASLLWLAANTVSQQLRVLRAARAVRVRREGRRAYYELHDSHVVDLLASIRHHAEHAS
jgi:ArsR family transcriptional regulator, lead/cadmium/zinc/bismuth-responsive transcriptional repressor